MKSNQSQDFQKFLIRQLRRISYLWYPRTEAMKLAKVSYGKYQCAHCKEIFSRNHLAIDHIEPVIATSGFIDWNTFIDRLFCDTDGYQILCKPCHHVKSKDENTERREIKKSSK